jgi:hypothetical protein
VHERGNPRAVVSRQRVQEIHMRLATVLCVTALTVLSTASSLRATVTTFTFEQSRGVSDADWCKYAG